MTTSSYRVVILFFGAVILTACGGSESSNIGTSASAFGIEGTGGCDSVCSNRFPNPVPAINAMTVLAPGDRYFQGASACVLVGTLDFTLSVFGTGFSTASVVEWNGSARPTTVVGNSANPILSAQISAGDVAAAGSVAVTVSNPAPGGGRSNAAAFTIAAAGAGGGANSLAVDPTGQFAYATIHDCSASSVGSGSVSIYRIDTTTGMLTSIGLVPSGDWGANSIAITPDGRFAYVGNDSDSGDGSSLAGGVSLFTADSTTGILTLTGFTPAPCDRGFCTPWSIAMHPSGRFLYVANEGGSAPNVSMYSIDATTGNLTLIGLRGTGGRAESVAVDPTGAFAYVFNENYPGLTPSVAIFTINATTGALTSVGTITGDASPTSVTVDPAGKFAYVTNSGSNDVSMYAINMTTGTLSKIGQVAAGSSPVGAAVHPTGKFLYVTNSASNDVSMYTRNATTGALTSIGRITAGIRPGAVTIDPTGNFVFVGDSNGVLSFRIDASTGALTLVGTVGT